MPKMTASAFFLPSRSQIVMPILGASGSLGGKLRWLYWRQGSAHAQGRLWTENCIPIARWPGITRAGSASA